MQKITPFLWYDDKAEEAANYYVSIFKNSRIGTIRRYGAAGPGPQGSVMSVEFELDGQPFIALNGGPVFSFSPAVSFFVNYIRGGEYKNASLALLMAQPYSRVLVLHFTILIGGFAMMALGSPVYGLLILVAVKTGVDVAAHRAERQKLGGAVPAMQAQAA